MARCSNRFSARKTFIDRVSLLDYDRYSRGEVYRSRIFATDSRKAGLRFIKTRLLRGCSTRGDEAINLVRYLIDLVEKAVIMVKKRRGDVMDNSMNF